MSVSLGVVTQPAGQLFQSPQEALSEKTWAGERKKAKLDLSKPPFISFMVAAYIAAR